MCIILSVCDLPILLTIYSIICVSLSTVLVYYYSRQMSRKRRPCWSGSSSPNSVLGTQGEQVPLPDGVEGSLSNVCHGIVDILAVACHPVCVGHEDYLTLPLSTYGGNQLPLEGIEWLVRLRPTKGPLVQTDVRVQG